MLIRLNCVLLRLAQVLTNHLQVLALLQRQVLRRKHDRVNIVNLLVHLRQGLLLLPQQTALQLVIKPQLVSLLSLLSRLGLRLDTDCMKETCHLLAFLFKLVAGDHESFGDVRVKISLVTLSQHLLDARYVTLLLRQKC